MPCGCLYVYPLPWFVRRRGKSLSLSSDNGLPGEELVSQQDELTRVCQFCLFLRFISMSCDDQGGALRRLAHGKMQNPGARDVLLAEYLCMRLGEARRRSRGPVSVLDRGQQRQELAPTSNKHIPVIPHGLYGSAAIQLGILCYENSKFPIPFPEHRAILVQDPAQRSAMVACAHGQNTELSRGSALTEHVRQPSSAGRALALWR